MSSMQAALALFHPLVVHFPVALLGTAILLEAVSLFRTSEGLQEAIGWNLHLGAVGSLAAVMTGWFRAAGMGFEPGLMPVVELHRWLDGIHHGTKMGAVIRWSLLGGLGQQHAS
jgi:uncharacterized membrane protein